MKLETIVRELAEKGNALTIHFHEGARIYDNHIENYYADTPKKVQQKRGKLTNQLKKKTEMKKVTEGSRQRGRPKATDKSLTDYACPGIDGEKLHAEIAQQLSQTLGTAENVAQLEKALITEHKIKAAIPYKLHKIPAYFMQFLFLGRNSYSIVPLHCIL